MKTISNIIKTIIGKKTNFSILSEGILLNNECMVSIDGRRLYQRNHLKKLDKDKSIIVPSDFFLLDWADKIEYEDNRIYISFGNIQLSMNILNGKYPNYKLYIPKKCKYYFSFSANDYLQFDKLSKKLRLIRRIILLIKFGSEIVFNRKLLKTIIDNFKNEEITLQYNDGITPFKIINDNEIIIKKITPFSTVGSKNF